MKNLLSPRQHFYVYYAALAMLVVGLPLSRFLMSVAEITLMANWLLEGHFKEKFSTFWHNKTALVLTSVFALHIIGLLYTSDFNYAAEDLRKKLPLLILPLIFVSGPVLTRKQIDRLLGLFIAAVTTGTMVSMAVLLGFTHKVIVDIRNISVFISHIRFSLLICVSIFLLGYYIYKSHSNLNKLLMSLLAIWMVIFLGILESITGLGILFITTVLFSVYFAFTRKKKLHIVLALCVITVFCYSVYGYVDHIVHKYYKQPSQKDFSHLDKVTSRGNTYFNDPHSNMVENGHYIWKYVCWSELKSEWNKRSSIPFDQKDLKGNEIKYTLIRFLTSKGYRKDADGVDKLTEKEIRSIERGVPNANFQDVSSLDARIYGIVWEVDNYMRGGNPSGHSVTQRIEFWKAAIGIIKANPIIGVGTGDVKQAFAAEYDKIHSPLTKEWRLRSHNQYLEIGVAFGFIGMAWFWFSLIWPVFREKKYRNYFYMAFFIIVVLSMLTEDTLETQAGVTFFAFFNSFFLFIDTDR